MDQVILRLLGVLEQLHEEKGVPKQDNLVDKNVIKADNSTFDSDKKEKSGLSSKQKKTLTETFSLFNQMFFDYQKKMRVDEKEKTKVSQIAKKQATPPPLPPQKKEASGFSLMSMIVGGLALLASSVGLIVTSLSGFFGNFGGVAKVIGKLGFIGALKIIGKTILKKFSMAVLKRLPVIGGIIGLGFAVKAFMNGDIFLGIAELISGLLNFIPGVGPILSLGADVLIAWAQAKGTFDKGGALSPENGWKTIQGWMKNIGKTIIDNALYLPIIGGFKRFGMAFDAFKSGQIGEGFKQLGLGLFTFVGGGPIIKGIEILAGWLESAKQPEGPFNKDTSWLGKIKQWIVKKLNDLPEFLKVPLRWFGVLDDGGDTSLGGMTTSAYNGAKEGVKKVTSFVGNLWDNVKGPMGDAVDSIGGFAKDAWNKTKEYTSKAWDVVSEEAPKVWASVKDISSKAWDKAKEAGSWFADSVISMAGKTKDMINEWIPNIVDSISGITNSAMEVLKNIASKIGGWIADLFSSDDQKKLVEAKKQSINAESLFKGSDDILITIASANNVQNKWLNELYKTSSEQVRLLGMLVNVGNSSLSELRRISGNNSGGGGTTVIATPPQSQKTPMVSIDNNRMGYATSPYSLG